MSSYRSTVLLLSAVSLLLATRVCAADKVYPFTSVDIGNIKAGSTTEIAPGKDFEIRGFGKQFGLHASSDEGRFVYTKLKGDFDITVQVRAVENENQDFGEVGLLVRKDLSPTALEVGQFVSNNFFGEHDQYTFIFRTKEGGSIEPWHSGWIPNFWGPGSHGNPSFGYYGKGWSKEYPRPRPFPYVWLRLIRTGNVYRGLIKEYLDSWNVLGQATLELGEEVLVGMAISANHHKKSPNGAIGDPNVATNVSFRNLTIEQP